MPKKSSLNPVIPNPEEIAEVEEKRPPTKRKKMGAEIEEIFSAIKRMKTEQATPGKTAKNKAANERRKERKKRKVQGESRERKVENTPSRSRKVENTPSRSRKKTNDGLTIYSEEELGFGKTDAGGSKLCPFDCACCF